MRTVVGRRDVRDVADRVDAGQAVDREVGRDVDAPAAAPRQPGGGGQRRRHDAAAPDHAAGLDHVPSASVTCPEPTSVTATPRCMRTPLRSAPWRRSRAPCRRTGQAASGRDRRCGSARRWTGKVGVLGRSSCRGSGPRARRRARRRSPRRRRRRSSARPASISDGSRSASSNTAKMRERRRCASSRRVERERVLLGSGGVEEVRLRALPRGRAHRPDALARRRSSAACVVGSTTTTWASLTSTFSWLGEELAQGDTRRRPTRVARWPPGTRAAETGGSCSCRSASPECRRARQLPSTGNSREAAADDDDVALPVLRRHGLWCFGAGWMLCLVAGVNVPRCGGRDKRAGRWISRRDRGVFTTPGGRQARRPVGGPCRRIAQVDSRTGIVPRTLVPWPGEETMSSVPPTAPIRSRMPIRPSPAPASADRCRRRHPRPRNEPLRRRAPRSRRRERRSPACLIAFWMASAEQK